MTNQTAALVQLIHGYRISQALYAAAQFGVFDGLAHGPQTSAHLAQASGAHAPSLYRLLRALTTVEVVHEDNDGRFSLTSRGELLRADHPESLRPQLQQFVSPAYWQAWGDLTETVRTGQPAFDRVHGEPFFDYLSARPEASAIFNAAMTSSSRLTQPAVLSAYDFSGIEKLVDLGGGNGGLLRALLARYPSLRGVLADLPAIVAQAIDLRPYPEAARAEFVGVNMFESVPPGAGAYLLQRILHDWSDDECVQILRNVRRAIRDDGRLLVVDAVIQPSNQPDPGKWTDLQMLVLLTGRERTAEEFRHLFARAGFSLNAIFPAGNFSIVEGLPVAGFVSA